jgi:hypothetical protein
MNNTVRSRTITNIQTTGMEIDRVASVVPRAGVRNLYAARHENAPTTRGRFASNFATVRNPECRHGARTLVKTRLLTRVAGFSTAQRGRPDAGSSAWALRRLSLTHSIHRECACGPVRSVRSGSRTASKPAGIADITVGRRGCQLRGGSGDVRPRRGPPLAARLSALRKAAGLLGYAHLPRGHALGRARRSGRTELFVNRESYDVYICSNCGHIDLFMGGIGEEPEQD